MSEGHHIEDILRWVIAQHSALKDTALVIIRDIYGGTLRAKGAMMAVTSESSFGYISAGCVDADILSQARDSLTQNEVKHLSYGQGSPFKDITLPCGGKIDVVVYPNPNIGLITQALDDLEHRRATNIKIGDFTQIYSPRLRLRLVGRGAPMTALANLTKISGFDTHLQSPDIILKYNPAVDAFDHLTDPSTPPKLTDDPWTAIITLFHDHDWEPAILEQALTGPAFYIGAMGSERTHAQRLETLKSMGVSDEQLDRIKGPIGLIPAMRDAQNLAVSILADVLQSAQAQDRL